MLMLTRMLSQQVTPQQSRQLSCQAGGCHLLLLLLCGCWGPLLHS
jgi:hypothetical protein